MKTYTIHREGRKHIQEFQSVLRKGDLTNFHIKGRTIPTSEGEYKVINDTPQQ